MIVSQRVMAQAKAAVRKAKRKEKAATLWSKKVKRPKSKSISQLESILWEVFATYIKLRDKRAFNGFCFYCSCRPIDSAMHRIKRGKRATKYDERNVHGGCHVCNFEDNFNPQKFVAIFIRNTSAGLFCELELKSRQPCPRTRVDIIEKTEEYREKVRLLMAA